MTWDAFDLEPLFEAERGVEHMDAARRAAQDFLLKGGVAVRPKGVHHAALSLQQRPHSTYLQQDMLLGNKMASNWHYY